MKKHFIAICAVTVFFVHDSCADALKNSLTTLMHQKEKATVVDLGEINLNAKPRPVPHRIKTRSGHAVVATINGEKILKKEADRYLQQRTNGKIKNFDLLPINQKKRLIQEMALPKIIAKTASKELTEEEKSEVYARTWMRKESKKVSVSDKELLEVYQKMKQDAVARDITVDFPEFKSIKERLKIQMIERKIIDNLLKTAQFQVMP